jgi:hypothetical protein
MVARFRPRSAYDVCAVLALFVAVGTGGAYAANTIGSDDVINDSLLGEDIKQATLKGGDIAPNTISSTRIIDDSLQSADVKDNSLTGDDVALTESLRTEHISGLHGSADIIDNTIAGTDIETNSIDSDEVVDHTLTARDVSKASGAFTSNLTPVEAGQCRVIIIDAGVHVVGETIAISPTWLASRLKVSWRARPGVPTEIELRACNESNTVPSPDPPAIQFSWVVFNN